MYSKSYPNIAHDIHDVYECDVKHTMTKYNQYMYNMFNITGVIYWLVTKYIICHAFNSYTKLSYTNCPQNDVYNTTIKSIKISLNKS